MYIQNILKRTTTTFFLPMNVNRKRCELGEGRGGEILDVFCLFFKREGNELIVCWVATSCRFVFSRKRGSFWVVFFYKSIFVCPKLRHGASGAVNSICLFGTYANLPLVHYHSFFFLSFFRSFHLPFCTIIPQHTHTNQKKRG